MVVFGLAAAGAAASAVAAILLVSDESLNRVYFGTDTRVQALLVGAAAAALLVRDWSALARYGAQIRHAVGALDRAAPAGHRAGDARRWWRTSRRAARRSSAAAC